jgi:hypothetical protein
MRLSRENFGITRAPISLWRAAAQPQRIDTSFLRASAGKCFTVPLARHSSSPLPPIPPFEFLSLLPSRSNCPAVAAHAAEDDAASHASSSASNSSPSPSNNKRNSHASAAAIGRLPNSAGGLGMGHVRWRAFQNTSHFCACLHCA